MEPYAARTLAIELMRGHGLHGWGFRFDRATRRFGSCRFRERVITLSRPLVILNSVEQVRDTILHEIAHALCPGDGHGLKWKKKCLELGARPRRCYREEEVVAPMRRCAPWRFGCARCDWWVERRRVTRRKYVCAKCRAGLVYQNAASRVDVGHF